MSWSVIEEIGIEYSPGLNSEDADRLRFPVYAAQAEDGSYLIVDELSAEKPIPFRLEYRTLRMDPHGKILYDTLQQGFDDGYGCLVDNGCLAILRRTRWELLLVSPEGTVTDCLDLTNYSKRMPRSVSWTDQQTFLVVFLDRSAQLDIVELDRQGRLLWYLPPNASRLGVPSGVQRLPTDTLLLADGFRHAALELDRTGNVVWQFGETGDPARVPQRLAGPSSARALADGRRLIADTRNHRVLVVHADGTSEEIHPTETTLCDPMFADVNRDGQFLICDSGNARVMVLDDQCQIVWQSGTSTRTQRMLSYPRSVEVTGPGKYLIADTAHDRIVRATQGRVDELPIRGRNSLFWPRCVRQMPSGSLLVADGRHGRIVELSEDGELLNQLSKVRLNPPRQLEDPHDVRLLANGHLLITDSPQDAVYETDWSGHVYRVVGGNGDLDLSDPHGAQQLDDGTLVICDTGRHRVLFVDSQGTCLHCLETIQGDSFLLRMSRPRYLEVFHNQTMVIVDTGHNRVLGATTAGQLLWEISHVPGSPIPHLYQPRWATLLNENEVVIADHFHHRIVRLRREPAQ